MGGHSRTHPGVSTKELEAGKHRIRWREIDTDGKKVAQSWTFYGTPAEAKVMAIQISQAIQTTGHFERPDDSARPTQPARPNTAELTDLFAAFYDWRINVKGARGSTLKTIAGALLAFERALRATQGIQQDDPIPVTMLTTRTCTEVLAWMRVTPTPSPKGRRRRDGSPARPSGKRRKPPGGNRLNQIMRYVHQAWVWGADEGEDAWPGLPTPPRQKSRIVPEPPVPSDPLEAPSWAEMDMLVRAARTLTRPESADVGDIFEVARGLGLRIGQVIGLEVGDFRGLRRTDTTMVRIRPELGKTKQERKGRTVPVAPVLEPLLLRLTEGRSPSQGLFDRDHPINPYTLKTIIKRASAEGLRPEVYTANERGNTRATHFMRAGFIHGLQVVGAPKKAVQRLVGHVASDTADGSYDPATLQMLIDAVERVPSVGDY